ncbi:hypothetical protein D3C80_1581910 [compost metagenome]
MYTRFDSWIPSLVVSLISIEKLSMMQISDTLSLSETFRNEPTRKASPAAWKFMRSSTATLTLLG